MLKNKLGKTDIEVSKLCFGSLTIGPLQGSLSFEDGGALLKYAYERGINFVDTAELYETYPHIRNSLRGVDRSKIVIATKSYAYSEVTAEESLKKALHEMGLDYIDIFLLHEQESESTIKGHYEAMRYFIKMKEKGYIKAFGISTHHISAVKASKKYKEIEVIHPIVNLTGLGIQDGSINEMLVQLEECYLLGKGIYGMKPLGGGNLLRSFKESFKFVLKLTCLHSIAVGMKTMKEIETNVKIINEGIEGFHLDENMLVGKRLSIAHWCEKCCKCIKACSHNALIIEKNEIKVDYSKCVVCGYCSRYCPSFCIKVV